MPVLLVLLRLAGLFVLAEGTSVLTRVNVRPSSMSSVLPQPHFQAEQCLEEPRREQLAPLVQPAPSVHRDEEEDGRAYARRPCPRHCGKVVLATEGVELDERVEP